MEPGNSIDFDVRILQTRSRIEEFDARRFSVSIRSLQNFGLDVRIPSGQTGHASEKDKENEGKIHSAQCKYTNNCI